MSPLPQGTVTLLFMDIEGSTGLTQQLGREYGPLLTDYLRLVRGALAEYDGQEVNIQGDTVFAVFDRATDAVKAAVALQRAFAGQGWPQNAAVAVRMGLHTGDPLMVEGQYVGMDVQRAAYIGKAGHGGQILLSLASQILVEDNAPPDVSLRPLGDHRLNDLGQPQPLFQVVIEGLPADFPPLRSLSRVPNNLPVQPTVLVGRETDVEALRGLLLTPNVRLITLTGPGGVGKTRLSLQVAADCLDRFPDGVYFVPLAATRDPALVPEALHTALGLAEAPHKSVLAVVLDALRTRQALIVLDNFEQIVEAQIVVSRVLSACPGVRFIVTSRIPLRLRAEREWPVSPLSVPRGRATVGELQAGPAIQLFLERARAIKPNLTLTDALLKAVAEICSRLDGLPLAIELAAARIRLLTPQAMLGRLNERLKLLSGGPRDLPARQQTLRAAIDWSYDLLTPGRRTVFRRLAVFVGGFSLEAAEQVLSLGATSPLRVLDELEALVNESLVQQREDEQGEPRFSLLQIIREYALERLDESGEAELLDRQHAQYYVQLAETAEPQLTGAEQTLWLSRLEAERDNLNAALEWAAANDPADLGLRAGAALWRFWYVRGHFLEGRRWLGRLLAQPSGPPSRSLALAWRGAGVLADSQADLVGAEAAFQQSLAVFRALNDLSGMARAGNSLGIIALHLGDRQRARGYFQDSLTIFRSLKDQRAIAHSLNQLGEVARQDGDYAGARSLFEQSLGLFRALGDEWGAGLGLINLGEVAAQQGDRQAAQGYYVESLELFQALGDRWFMARALDYMGALAADLGQARRAGRLWSASQAIRRDLGATLNPNDQSRLDLSIQQARAADDAAFSEGWDEGEQMSYERAIDLARQRE